MLMCSCFYFIALDTKQEVMNKKTNKQKNRTSIVKLTGHYFYLKHSCCLHAIAVTIHPCQPLFLCSFLSLPWAFVFVLLPWTLPHGRWHTGPEREDGEVEQARMITIINIHRGSLIIPDSCDMAAITSRPQVEQHHTYCIVPVPIYVSSNKRKV